VRDRSRHRPVEQRTATIVHHPQSIGPDRPVPRPGEALGACQCCGAVDRWEVKRSDNLWNAASKPFELDQEHHRTLLNRVSRAKASGSAQVGRQRDGEISPNSRYASSKHKTVRHK
jgi:hypothetical protein